MVSIYITNVLDLPDPKENPDLLSHFPKERRKKTLRYRQEKDRKQSLGAGALLRYILQSRKIEETETIYGEHGKPEMPGIYFNISHSGDYVVCAVGDGIVGCDIEKIGQFRGSVVKRFFTEKETSYINAFSGERKNEEFYRLWTMKESYVKMTGEGLTLDSKRIEFSLGENVQVYRDGVKVSCTIKEYLLSGYKLTVCSEDVDFAEEVEFVPCLK